MADNGTPNPIDWDESTDVRLLRRDLDRDRVENDRRFAALEANAKSMTGSLSIIGTDVAVMRQAQEGVLRFVYKVLVPFVVTVAAGLLVAGIVAVVKTVGR